MIARYEKGNLPKKVLRSLALGAEFFGEGFVMLILLGKQGTFNLHANGFDANNTVLAVQLAGPWLPIPIVLSTPISTEAAT